MGRTNRGARPAHRDGAAPAREAAQVLGLPAAQAALARGLGSTKKIAEQDAARRALEQLTASGDAREAMDSEFVEENPAE